MKCPECKEPSFGLIKEGQAQFDGQTRVWKVFECAECAFYKAIVLPYDATILPPPPESRVQLK